MLKVCFANSELLCVCTIPGCDERAKVSSALESWFAHRGRYSRIVKEDPVTTLAAILLPPFRLPNHSWW